MPKTGRGRGRPRKVTRRNASTQTGKLSSYAPKAKKRFKNMSNPIAENKQLTGAELSLYVGRNNAGTPIFTDFSDKPRNWPSGEYTGAEGHIANTPHWTFIPDSACYKLHGLDEHQMVGRSVYQTISSAKFLIKWPQASMNTGINKYGQAGSAPNNNLSGIIPEYPMTYKLYWGEVPLKYLFTGNTSPQANACSAVDLESLVNQRIVDYFNARKDRIEFIPKHTSTLKIHGSKVLKPEWKTTTGTQPVSTKVVYDPDDIAPDGDSIIDETYGTIPDTLVKVKWNLNRKLHFEPTNDISGDTARHTADPTTYPDPQSADVPTVFYRNYSGRIPFAVLVSWNHDKLPVSTTQSSTNEGYERERRCPQVLVNDITYFRDS